MLSLIATIGANLLPWERAVGRMQQIGVSTAKNVGAAMKSHLAAAFGVGAITAWGQSIARGMGKIKDQAEQFQLTTTEVQKLDKAAQKTGLSFDNFGTALTQFAQKRKEAVESSRELRQSAEEWGVAIEDLNDPLKSDLDIIKQMAGSSKALTASNRELSEWFGTRGGKLMQAVREFQNISDEGLFRPEDIEATDKMLKDFELMKKEAEAIVGTLSPFISKWIDLNKQYNPAFRTFKAISEELRTPGQPKPPPESTPGALSAFENIFRGAGPSNIPQERGSRYKDTLESKLDDQKAELNAKIFEIQSGMRFQKMGPAQQQDFLRGAIKREQDLANAIRGQNRFANTDLQRSQNDLEATQHELKAAELKARLQDMLLSGKPMSNFDPLTRIGGFNAFSDTGISPVNIQQQQIAVLRNIERNTAKAPTPHGN